jgi:A/G-specific adenine glycosylase
LTHYRSTRDRTVVIRSPGIRGPSGVGVSSRRVEAVRARLIIWGPTHRRRFAWRRTRSPYRVLLAELLLQRTKAEHVPDVYRSLIEIAPNATALSNLPPASLSRLVRPLGLRKRVPLMRRMAASLVKEHRGKVPHGHHALISLPGLGPYGANAIACLAYGESVAMVDGGVCRVLRRIFSVPQAKRATSDAASWELAQRIVSKGNARTLNLALLDLASGVCKPQPKCEICPLSNVCDWHLQRAAAAGS